MFSNSKLLIIASFLIIASGLGLMWFGLTENLPVTTPSAENLENNSPTVATDSGVESKLALETLGIDGDRAFVTKVIDGDTIQLENGQRVRLIGIDTPETKDPRKSVQCFGKEAYLKSKELLEGRAVILQQDVSESDKYSRLLRYIFLPLENGQMLFVNDYLVREGFAKVLTYPPDVKYNEQLREAEQFARQNNKGLWGGC